MTVAAVITAAGYGTRLGSDLPKALVVVHGRTLLAHALDRVTAVASVIVVTAPSTHVAQFADEVGARATVVVGGESRQASVLAGVRALGAAGIDDDDIVLVHDAARAFMPAAAMRRAVDAVRAGADAAIPVIPVVDTLVSAPDPDGAYGESVDRESLRAVQTPQVFRAVVLDDAHRRAATDGLEATDDATLVRHYDYSVVATEGHVWGFKVTHMSDLALAEHIAAQV